jgi:hypothetical protein
VSNDLATGIAQTVGAAAGGVVSGGTGGVLELITTIGKLGLTPGGQEVIQRMFPSIEAIKAEQIKLDAAIALEKLVGPPRSE